MPQFETLTAKAYAVEDIKSSETYYMAYICNHMPPPRFDTMQRLAKIRYPGFINVVSWVIDKVPNEKGQRLIIIAARPRGEPLVPRGTVTIQPKSQQEIKTGILPPIVDTLKVLHDHHIPYRALHPENLFYQNVENTSIVLGECFTMPPAYNQPAIFQTIQMGQCLREARGIGSIHDDMYALGCLIIFFLLGNYPHIDVDIEEMTYGKLEKNSLNYLLPHDKTGSFDLLRPLLNGLMADNDRERWNISEVRGWLDGKSIRLRAGPVDLRSTRPKIFYGHKNYACDELAYSMSRTPKEAMELLISNDLLNWLRASIVDPHKTEEIEEIVGTKESFLNADDYTKRVILNRVLLHLSNKLPICWNDLSIMPGGIGLCLADALFNKKPTKNLEELIYARMVSEWEETQRSFDNDPPKLSHNYDALPKIIYSKVLGYGLENCLYTIYSDVVCLSPLVQDQYVIVVDGLLPALEIAAMEKRGDNLLDQHICAFLMARSRIFRENDMRSLLVNDPLTVAMNHLRIFSKLQSKTPKTKVPNLAGMMFRHVRRVIGQYYHKTTKDFLEEECQKVVQEGNLIALKKLIDNPQSLDEDHYKFHQACAYYDELENKVQYIKNYILENQQGGAHEIVGRTYAVITSGILSIISLVSYFIYYFL